MSVFVTCASNCGMMITEHEHFTKCRNANWYDDECTAMKQKKYQLLDHFRTSGDMNVLAEFRHYRNYYRTLCRHKKEQYEDKVITDLSDNCSNAKRFWSQLQRLTRPAHLVGSSISANEWVNYFEGILNIDYYNIDQGHCDTAHLFVSITMNSYVKYVMMMR